MKFFWLVVQEATTKIVVQEETSSFAPPLSYKKKKAGMTGYLLVVVPDLDEFWRVPKFLLYHPYHRHSRYCALNNNKNAVC
jgi:hypothetical protein